MSDKGFGTAPQQRGGVRGIFRQWWIILVAACLSLVACTESPAVQNVLPNTGAGELTIHEYAIVEQSADNPNHPEFVERARQAVLLERTGWDSPPLSERLSKENQVLTPFGFRVSLNLTPPFSGYALYQGDRLIYRDIARFSELSLRSEPENFNLPFETISGDWLVASAQGLQKISAAPVSGQTAAPVMGGPLAYAALPGSAPVLYRDSEPALEQSGEAAFGQQWVGGQAFYFFTDDNSTHVHLNYGGSVLPYYYDDVVHGLTGETAIYNPGSDGHIVWFYGLRDGLWYYVEASSRGR